MENGIAVTRAMAYTEVLELLKYIPSEEYAKIPQKEIYFFEKNRDENYEFSIEYVDDIMKNNISRKAYAIMVSLYKNYFIADDKKEKLEELLRLNTLKAEKEKTEKYNSDNLFKKYKPQEINVEKVITNEVAMIQYKESAFKKIWNKIINIFKK